MFRSLSRSGLRESEVYLPSRVVGIQFNIGQEVFKAEHNGVTIIREQVCLERQRGRESRQLLRIVKAERHLPKPTHRRPPPHGNLPLSIRVKSMSNLLPDTPRNDGNGTARINNGFFWLGPPTPPNLKRNVCQNPNVANNNPPSQVIRVNCSHIP